MLAVQRFVLVSHTGHALTTALDTVILIGPMSGDFVGRNLWICDIHGSACAIDGSIVCAEIHGYLRNLWIRPYA